MPLQVKKDELTIADLNAATLGGKASLAAMLREFSQPLTFGSDLPLRMASGKNEDVGTFEEPWEYNKNSALTDIDSGEKISKFGTYSRKDIMGMRSSAIQYRIKQKMAMGPQFAQYVTWELAKHLQAIGLDNEHDLFYADVRDDSKSFVGLYPRFWTLTDEDGVITSGSHQGEISMYVTLDAGGKTSGKLSSIFLLVPGARDGVCRIYPEGTDFSGSVQFDEGHWETIEDNGEATRIKTDFFLLVNGLAIMNRRACVRIANVDVSTEEGCKGLERALYRAQTVIPAEMRSRAITYCSDKIIPDLKMYYNSKVVPPSYEAAKPHNIAGDFEISGLGYFRPSIHITRAESVVA